MHCGEVLNNLCLKQIGSELVSSRVRTCLFTTTEKKSEKEEEEEEEKSSFLLSFPYLRHYNSRLNRDTP